MLLWTDDMEYKYQRLYIKHKGTPLEDIVNRLGYSKYVIYHVSDYQFWRVLKRDEIRDTKQKQKRTRIRRYVRGMFDTFSDNLMLSSHVYLVTLTFDDDSLALLSSDTRKRYVREYLGRVNLDYFACIDFGKVSCREHYHAVCAIKDDKVHYVVNDKVKRSFLQYVDTWAYGYHSIKPIRTDHKSLVKSCAYTFKASAYALKNADSEHIPFHARGVEHQHRITDDFELRVFERALESASLNRLSSGFEVARPKASYESPYCWIGEPLNTPVFRQEVVTETTGL